MALPLTLRLIDGVETYFRRPLARDPVFIVSTIEVLFSIYYVHLTKRIQARFRGGHYSRENVRELVRRITGVGFRPVTDLTQNSSPTDISQSALALIPEGGFRRFTKEMSLLKPVYHDDPSAPKKIPPGSVYGPTTRLNFDDPQAVSFRNSQILWFNNAKFEDIWYENFADWLSGVVYNMTYEEIVKEDSEKLSQGNEKSDELRKPFIEELISLYEMRFGHQFKPGYNPKLKHKVIKPTLDPIKIYSRPLFVYGVAYTTKYLIHWMLQLNGFQHKKCYNREEGLKYLVRIPKGWSDQPVNLRETPLIFVHGVGYGLIQYISVIHYLTFSEWAQERPVVILLQPSISMEIFSNTFLKPPKIKQVVGDVDEIMKTWKLHDTGIDILSHSNGTVVSGWIMKAFPNLVKRCCLIDPVCFGLWEAHICYNFLYRKPKTGVEKVMRYSLGTEPGIACYVHRHFDWCTALLWPHEIPGFSDPDRFMVVTSGRDTIVHAESVRNYLLAEGMKDAFPNQNKSYETKAPAEMLEKEAGGLVTDWEAGHGETFMPDSPYFSVIKNWLEGGGYKI